MTHSPIPVKLGITCLLERERKLLDGARVGLITNSASVDEQAIPTATALLNAGITVKRLFSPEHGYNAAAPPGDTVADALDAATGLPVCSLYGENKKPGEETLQDLDALVFDLQDVGVRCYTYIWTMALAMQSAAYYGKLFVVLDRPNPLAGVLVQGPMLDPAFSSFMGLFPIPLRHGLTAGELSLLFNEAFGVNAQLAVVKMNGWRRRLYYSDTGLKWIAPSPAMRSPETAVVYTGTCLFEGTNISEGRGTESPFRLIGAPWLEPAILNDLDERWTAGFALSLQKFIPAFSKCEGEECKGISIHVIENRVADPIALTVELLRRLARRHPQKLQWRSGHFDAVAGTDRLRRDIIGGRTTEDILNSWNNQLHEFESLRSKYLLYEG